MCFCCANIFCRQAGAFPSSAEPVPGQRQNGSDSGLRMGPIRSSDIQNEPSANAEPNISPTNDGQHTRPVVKSKSRGNLKADARSGRRVYGGGYKEATTPVKVAEHELQQHQAEVHGEEGEALEHSVEVGAHIGSCPLHCVQAVPLVYGGNCGYSRVT